MFQSRPYSQSKNHINEGTTILRTSSAIVQDGTTTDTAATTTTRTTTTSTPTRKNTFKFTTKSTVPSVKSSSKAFSSPTASSFSSSNSTSFTRTPGRNFFQKLFCTPGKSALKKSLTAAATAPGVTAHIPAVTPKKQGFFVTPKKQSLSLTSSAVQSRTTHSAGLIKRSLSSTGRRIDFCGEVINIDPSTTHRDDTDTSPSSTTAAATTNPGLVVAVSPRVHSRVRQPFFCAQKSMNMTDNTIDSGTTTTATTMATASSSPFSSSPKLARRLLEDKDTNVNPTTNTTNNNNNNCQTNKITEANQENASITMMDDQLSLGGNNNNSTRGRSRTRIDEDLAAAATSPERQNGMIFLNHSSSSSSSSEADNGLNENYLLRHAQASPDHDKTTTLAMKNPGMCIPTPAVIKRETPGGYHSEDLSGLGMVFSRPLRTAMESPLAKTNTSSDAAPPLPALVDQREQQHPVSSSNDDDDDAFLPDDFKKPEQTYTWAQVQQFVEQAKADSRDKQKHLENEIDDLNQKFEQHLKQQGLLWKQEKEAEYSRLNQMLKEEKNKTAQTLNEMTAKLNHCETDREFLLLRVSELEAAALSDPHKRDAAAKDTTIVELNRQLLILEKELDELREAQVVESNHEELIILKGEKTAAERQVFDLSERLRIRTESNNEALKRLEDAENEISFLKQQMSVPAAGEELDNAKAEIEQLKSLRAKDEQEMEGLRTQMKRVNEQYQAVLYTPKKRNGNNAPESPCSEVDILQVDNDKLHEQLKAMGNILKRYKLERDEFKARMDHMEKSHVEAIEIAVKHATEQWKNKNTELSKQVEAIDKMTESTKAVQLEELKSQFKQEKEELLAGHKEEISRYENEIQLIRSKSHEETDKLKQELEMEKDKAIKAKTLECEKLEKQILAMSEMHEEEIELVKSEFNDEIHRLQSELSSGSSREAQEEPVSKIKSQLQEVIDDLQTKLDTTTLEKNDLANKVKTLESSLAKVQAVADNAINEKDLLKRDMENRHQQLVDDLTAELDLVEAENSERVRKLQDDLKAKDTVIAAMGSQLADYESRFTKVGESQESLRKEVETLREEVQKAQVEADAKRQEIARINEEHQRAIDEAVDEVATKAEKQFEERNQRWRVLKSNFDEQTSKISVLERDLRLANKERDELQRTHEAREADLKDELAQARAAVAKVEANMARIEKNHLNELDQAKDLQMKLQTQLKEAQATCNQVQKSLAVVVNERDLLRKEVTDLKAVSDELMAIVEENGLG